MAAFGEMVVFDRNTTRLCRFFVVLRNLVVVVVNGVDREEQVSLHG